MMKRVSVDIGGTFTDCFLSLGAEKFSGKSLTTHHNLAIGFNSALQNAAQAAGVDIDSFIGELDSIRYATTLGTNALIERTGPRIGLITTAGFEATVPLSRGRGYGDGMPEHYQRDLSIATRPEPLVPIQMIVGVKERIDGAGEIVVELSEPDVRAQIRALVDRGAQAIVVSLINAIVNPEHELRIQEIILEEYPSHMLGAIPVTLSHHVSGRRLEYARTTSAVINAYLHATMYHGLASMEQTLRGNGYEKPMMLVHNSGGMAQLSSTSALQSIHSGPIAGINAAEHLSKESDIGNLICADMGGTSFDLSLVVGGGVKFYDFNPVIDRWLCTVPMVHLLTLGAGGGSIAHVDRMYRTIAVGPHSAGSEPGPACYNKGGLSPTVTDADLILGYLDARYYAGGKLKLSSRRAEHAILDEICDHTDLSVKAAAIAIKRKINHEMANGIVRELGSKGYSANDFTLLAYGGNGPLHACGICKQAGIRRIFIPPFSSVFSALGAGNIDQVHIHEHSSPVWVYDAQHKELLDDYDEINGIIESLEEMGKADIRRQNDTLDGLSHRLEFDMRYGSQRVETSVAVDFNRFESVKDVIEAIAAFAEDYQKRYGEGSSQAQAGVLITTVRVVTTRHCDRMIFENMQVPAQSNTSLPAAMETRTCFFVTHPDGIETPVFRTEDLAVGNEIVGPAVVVSQSTTALVEPGWRYLAAEDGSAWMLRVDYDA